MNTKMMKWMICFLLIVSLLVPGMSVNAAFADDGKALVKVRVVGLDGFWTEHWVNIGPSAYVNTNGESVEMDKPTAMGALVQSARLDDLEYVAETMSFGVYVKKVGDFVEQKPTANMGWGVWVNGEMPQVGADQAEIKDGDMIVWGFYDWEKTLYPKLELPKYVKQGEPFQMKVMADQTTYDANFNAVKQTVPVPGVTVTVIDKTYVTDANGVATVTVDHAGLNAVFTEKVDAETKTPLLLDAGYVPVLAADPNLSFTDLAGYEWAKTEIEAMGDKGIVVGDGLGHFLPGKFVSRGELAKMLSLSGDMTQGGLGGFMDTDDDSEFEGYIRAVKRKGYMNGYAVGDPQSPDYVFKPEQGLTREELAVVLVRAAGLQPATGTVELPYSDQALVKEYARPYLKTAYDNGLMIGDAEGTFRPQATVKRAEAAKALVNVLNQYDVK